ncbi:transcriptional regulator [Arthrobacter sulfonylureivorans]|uniref:Transcriptional regulator n=1 Tax=Arthrobacter sulfonylureivorans TaxID=2486855 RepID=A0ABY3W743_9MICC|nr:transcriptional regulator [Arthrobacter sulfonylureivorans]UNK46090.1 transcriptional regulator [Arthrobacter sulfonylureivorans]
MSRDPNEAKGFGIKVRETRELGLLQTELGKRSRVSRPTSARVEAGSDVSTVTLTKVTAAPGLKVGIEKGQQHDHVS